MFACIRRLSFVCLGVASSSHVRGMLLVRQCGRAALKEKLIMQNSHLTRLEAFASADARFCHMCGLQREQETQAWHGLHVLVCRRSARLKGFEQAGFFFTKHYLLSKQLQQPRLHSRSHSRDTQQRRYRSGSRRRPRTRAFRGNTREEVQSTLCSNCAFVNVLKAKACALCQNQTDSKIKGKHLVETARLLGVRGPRQRILRWNDWCCKGCRSDLSKKFATVAGLHASCLHTDRFLRTLCRAPCSTMQGHRGISSQPMSFRLWVACKLANPEPFGFCCECRFVGLQA